MKTEDSFEVESRYVHNFDILAIKITKPYEYKESIELEEGIILDFSEDNIPVALEILNASQFLKVPKYSLNNSNNINISMTVSVNKESIILKALFEIIIHNNEQVYSVESFTSNISQIPQLKAELTT